MSQIACKLTDRTDFGKQYMYCSCSFEIGSILLYIFYLCRSLGHNGSILAYGQTGSGKTYTMEGDSTSDDGMGVIPRCFKDIFEEASTIPETHTITVHMSHVEVRHMIYI